MDTKFSSCLSMGSSPEVWASFLLVTNLLFSLMSGASGLLVLGTLVIKEYLFLHQVLRRSLNCQKKGKQHNLLKLTPWNGASPIFHPKPPERRGPAGSGWCFPGSGNPASGKRL